VVEVASKDLRAGANPDTSAGARQRRMLRVLVENFILINCVIDVLSFSFVLF